MCDGCCCAAAEGDESEAKQGLLTSEARMAYHTDVSTPVSPSTKRQTKDLLEPLRLRERASTTSLSRW